MDPIGFAMENFDGNRRWRDQDAGNPIDAYGVFPGGEKFDGMAGLKAALLSTPKSFVSTITEKLMMYGLGRNAAVLRSACHPRHYQASARNNYNFQSLILEWYRARRSRCARRRRRRGQDGAALMALNFQ